MLLTKMLRLVIWQCHVTLIVKNTTRLVSGFIAVFAVYIALTGHLGPGGGFVFNPVHNVRARTPVDNLLALLDTLKDCSTYA